MKLKIKLATYSLLLIIFAGTTPVFADTTTIDITSSTAQLADPITPTDPTEPPSSTLFIRYQDNLIWSGPVTLTSTVYHDSINNLDYPLATPTVFSALVLADQTSDAFNISDAQYNQAFNSFYLACLAFPTSSSTENACYNWNFVVNNTYPNAGMDSYTLHGGENIYIYFSNPWKITASTSTFAFGTTTTIQTWRYQYDNLIDPWILDGNNIIDISVPNPASTGWWDAYTVATSTQTDASGAVDYMFTATGTYQLNFHDFTKWSPLDITINEPVVFATSSTTTPIENSNNSGGASGGQTIAISGSEISDAVQKILNFLRSKQTENGAIMDLQTSDWSAMSFGANGTYANNVRTSTASLHDYLYSTIVTSTSETLNICAEYPRHILGLLSASTNKTDAKIIELKNKINTECFAGGIVGQNGINDDIFITIALLATDENPNSAIIQTAIQTIISDQQASGAFTWSGWPSQDVTGAAINALKYAAGFGIAIDNTIFQNAKNYLHTTQLADGGWTGFGETSDPLTTGWALYGINALGEGQLQWTNSNQKNPWSVLVATLDNNGYYTSPWSSSDGIDWFGTKHAVPSLLGKSWPIILNPTGQPGSGGSGGGTHTAPQETSTSSVLTDIISTSTAPTSTEVADPVAATSTPIVVVEPTSTGQILGISIANTEIQTEPKKPTRAPVQTKAQTQPQPETKAENNPAPTNTQNQNDILETNTILTTNYTNRILYSVLAGIIGIIGYIIIIKIKK